MPIKRKEKQQTNFEINMTLVHFLGVVTTTPPSLSA